MKNVFILLFVISTSACAQSISQYTKIGGLNTINPSHVIPPNDFQDLQDVFTDNEGYVEMRGGLATLYTTTGPVQQQYEFINLLGNKYRIIKSSVQLGYIDTTDTYRLLISTLPESSRLWKMSLRNECYLGTDQKTDRWLFDPTATTVLTISTYIPCGKYPIVSGDKAFMINITTPMTNDAPISVGGDESIVLYSKIGNLKDWGYVASTITSASGTSQWIAVNRNDGETLTGGFVQSSNLFVTKKHLLGSLLGIWNNDTTDGERFSPLNTNIGCVAQDSIVTLNGKTYFTSADGEVEFNGTSYRIISDDIRDDFRDITNNTGVIGVGSQKIYTTATDWGVGTCTNVDTTTINGSITLQTGNSQLNQTNDKTETGYFTSGTHYQTFMTSYTLRVNTISIKGYAADTTVTYALYDGDNLLAIHSWSTEDIEVTPQWHSVDFSTWCVVLTSGTTYKIQFTPNSGTFIPIYTVGNTYNRGTADGSEINDFIFRMYLNYHSNNCYGQWSSPILNIPNFQQWGEIEANFEPTTSGATNTDVKFHVSLATGAGLVSTTKLIPLTTGYTIPSSSGAYVIVLASMTTADIGVSPKLNDITLNYITTSGNSESVLVSFADEQNYRLWVSGIKEGSSVNDVVYVWQGKNEKWTKLNLNARSFLNYSNELNIGSSNHGFNSKIWKYSTDYTTDAGIPINPMAHTPDYIPSSRLNDTKFLSLWVYLEPTSLYAGTTLYYYINKADTAYKDVNIPLASYANFDDMFIKYKVPSDLEFTRGLKLISFKFVNFSRLYGFDFLYSTWKEGEK